MSLRTWFDFLGFNFPSSLVSFHDIVIEESALLCLQIGGLQFSFGLYLFHYDLGLLTALFVAE